MELTTQIDGVTVKGRNISKSNDMVIVVITQPYHDLITRRHIPTSIPWREGTGEVMRKECSLRLLEQIYKSRHHLELNREFLVAELAQFKDQPYFPYDNGKAQFFRKVRDLKEKLRPGTKTRKSDDSESGYTRFPGDNPSYMTISILDAFFSQNFSVSIKDDLREQLIALLVE
jgi:hypothetical protein